MIADILLKIQAMKHAGEESKPYYPRPSISGPLRCLRQMVYWANGEPQKPLSGRTFQVFEDSSWAEELTADLMRQSAFHVHSEQMPITIRGAFPWMPEGTWHCERCEDLKVKDTEIHYTSCHGHIDWVATDVIGVDRLIEHKGLSHFGFEALWKGEMPYDYLTQMAIYFRGLQQDNPDLREGILLVKNKNQSAFLECRVTYDGSTDTMVVIDRVHHTGERQDVGLIIENITRDAFARFAEVERYRVSGELPERQYEHSDWRATYCPYGKACWSTWAEEHEKLTDDAVLEGEVVDIVKLERQRALEEAVAKIDKEEFRKGIKNILKAAGVRQARVGEYIVEWSVGSRKKLNEELLPVGAYQAALEEVPTERLTVRLARKKED